MVMGSSGDTGANSRLDRYVAIIQELAHQHGPANSAWVFLPFDPNGPLPVSMTPAAFAARVRDYLALRKRIATEKKIVAD